jgi:hypothetical protein
MKTSFTLFFIAACFQMHARILTVSNMPDSPGQYTSLTAITMSPGDTILVHGSTINYGSVFIAQNNIVIIGAGHNPDKQFPYTTSFTEIRVSGDNVQLIGIIADRVIAYGMNFTMRRCKILSLPGYPGVEVSSRFDTNSLFESNVFMAGDPALSITITNNDIITIRNNVFAGSIGIQGSTVATNCAIKNNIFIKGIQAFQDISSATISNNIFYGSSPFVRTSAPVNYYNNISFQCLNNYFTIGPNITLSNNLEGVDPQLVNYPGGSAGFSDSHDYNLAPGSPCIASGSDGTDRGVYGGFGTIFNMRGEPPISVITGVTITSPTTVAPGGTLNITVTSKHVH